LLNSPLERLASCSLRNYSALPAPCTLLLGT
jgi:hypothetical protein